MRALFTSAPFVSHLGIQLRVIEPGCLETVLPLRPEMLQQDGFAHAGVVATLADHTAGGAALSSRSTKGRVLSIEFKVNLLRPASGASLRCRATTLRAGRTISVVESEVYGSHPEKGEVLAAKATVTLAMLDA